MKKLLIALLFAPLTALASGAAVHLDKVPDVQGNKAALQNGAKLFVTYCLNCHGASFVRYNRLTELGLTEQEVKDNLMTTAEKIGEPMRVAIRAEEARKWFGATPPDLTLVTRARASENGPGDDWVYTYLRSFYQDDKRPTGWNNTVFENVGMPHILYELQGTQVLNHETHKLELVKPGAMTPSEYDDSMRDLVGFLVWMGEPGAGQRKSLGFAVLAFLFVLFGVTYALKKEFWKDIH